MSENIIATKDALTQAHLLEEFSIIELEQRLEFEAWCDSESNGNCSPGCSGGPTMPTNTGVGCGLEPVITVGT